MFLEYRSCCCRLNWCNTVSRADIMTQFRDCHPFIGWRRSKESFYFLRLSCPSEARVFLEPLPMFPPTSPAQLGSLSCWGFSYPPLGYRQRAEGRLQSRAAAVAASPVTRSWRPPLQPSQAAPSPRTPWLACKVASVQGNLILSPRSQFMTYWTLKHLFSS